MSVGLLGEDVGRVRGKTGRQQEAHSIAFDVSAIAIKKKKNNPKAEVHVNSAGTLGLLCV